MMGVKIQIFTYLIEGSIGREKTVEQVNEFIKRVNCHEIKMAANHGIMSVLVMYT